MPFYFPQSLTSLFTKSNPSPLSNADEALKNADEAFKKTAHYFPQGNRVAAKELFAEFFSKDDHDNLSTKDIVDKLVTFDKLKTLANDKDQRFFSLECRSKQDMLFVYDENAQDTEDTFEVETLSFFIGKQVIKGACVFNVERDVAEIAKQPLTNNADFLEIDPNKLSEDANKTVQNQEMIISDHIIKMTRELLPGSGRDDKTKFWEVSGIRGDNQSRMGLSSQNEDGSKRIEPDQILLQERIEYALQEFDYFAACAQLHPKFVELIASDLSYLKLLNKIVSSMRKECAQYVYSLQDMAFINRETMKSGAHNRLKSIQG